MRNPDDTCHVNVDVSLQQGQRFPLAVNDIHARIAEEPDQAEI